MATDLRAILSLDSNKFDLGIEKATKEVKNFKKTATNAGKQYDQSVTASVAKTQRFNTSLKDTQSSLSNLINNFKSGNISGFNSSIQDLKGNFGELRTSIKEGGISLEGFSKIAKGAGLAALAVGVAEAGKAWYEYNKGLEEATLKTQLFTGGKLQGTDLEHYRNEVIAVSEAYGKEFSEVLLATNSLAKQFGIDFQTALEYVRQGFVAGADANGEFLDSLREYPAYFKEAGISADLFVAIISQSVLDGVFSDKGVDAIKEGNLRIREMTKATSDALNALGIDAEETSKKLEEGSTTTFEVMLQVAEKLSQLNDQSPLVGQALADIFGGPGEDAGVQYIRTLKDIQTNLDVVTDKSSDIAKAKDDQITGTVRLKNAWSDLFDMTTSGFSSMVSNLNNSVSNALAGILEKINNIIRRFREATSLPSSDGKSNLLKIQEESLKYSLEKINKIPEVTVTAPRRKKTGSTGSNRVGRSGSVKSGSNKPTYKEGSIGWYDNLISELNNKIKFEVDPNSIHNILKKIEDLKNKKGLLEWKAKIADLEPVDTSKIKPVSVVADITKIDDTKLKGELAKNVTKGNLLMQANNIQASFDKGDILEEEARKKIDAINLLLDEAGFNIKVELDTTKLDQLKQKYNDVGNAINSMGDALASAGQTFENPELNVAGVIAQGIANLVLGYGQASAQASSLTPFGWIAFVAAGLATLMATIALIHSITSSGSYASGGIIGGNSFHGDNLIANVNAGEMIINRRLLGNLFNLLDSSSSGGSITGGVVKVQGSDLYLALKNYSKTQNKLGKNIGIK